MIGYTPNDISDSSVKNVVDRRFVRVMTTPPTVTLSAADAATSISGGTLKTWANAGVASAAVDIANDPFCTVLGTPSLTFGTSVNAPYAVARVLTGSNASKRFDATLVFNTFADTWEYVFKALSTAFYYKIKVDGQYVAENATYVSGLTSNSIYRLIVAHGSVAPREIELTVQAVGMGGITTAPAHTVSRVDSITERPTIVLGDSITAGQNQTAGVNGYTSADSWVMTTAALLGWRNVYNAAIAGTGFYVAGTDTNFQTRIAADILAYSPRRVVIMGGFNDAAVLASDFSAAVDVVFAQLATLLDCEVIVLGCWAANNFHYTNPPQMGVDTTLKAKASAYGFKFIDNFGRYKWITGSGKVGTTAGNGNADVCIASDGTHPTRLGCQHVGRRVADAISALS